jgi:hypothetical protein
MISNDFGVTVICHRNADAMVLASARLRAIHGKYYFADLRMTFRQNFFLQDWFRNKLGVGLG